jgi:RNA polymerase sigma-70 factor (ECF subfamily)
VNTLPAAQAVEVLIREYGKLVFHTIYGMTGDWEESQDLTQDTFHQALKSIDAARAASGAQFHPKAWLLRIALNTVRMQQRRRMLFRFIPFSHMRDGRSEETESLTSEQRPSAVQPGGYGSPDAGDPAELIAEQDVVQRALARLPEPLRVCLLLSIVSGLSNSEIAEMLDLNEPAVRQRLTRARKQFQQVYTQESGEELHERKTDNANAQRENNKARNSRHAITHTPLFQSHGM